MDEPRKPVTATGLPLGMTEQDLEPTDKASPEEQGIYNQMVGRLGRHIWNPKNQARLLAQMNHRGKEAWETIGTLTYNMVKAEANKAKAAGDSITTDIAAAVAQDAVIPWLFELGQAAKILPKMDDGTEQQQMGMSLMQAMKLHGEALMAGPDRDKHQEQAQNFYAEQVAKEADAGVVAPGLLRQNPLAAGVSREMRGAPRGT